MEEVFKPVPGHPEYKISNTGKLKRSSRKSAYVYWRTGNVMYRTSREKITYGYTNNVTGYKQVTLTTEGKAYTATIHRIVAAVFIPNPENHPCVNHKDGNKLNNRVDNLEWCTHLENHTHAALNGLKARGSRSGQAILNESQVKEIKTLLSEGLRHNYIAKLFGISRPQISLINTNKSWKHVLHLPTFS